MTIDRIRVAWSGAPVIGPGVSTFYMDPAKSSGPADLVTFFGAIKAAFPAGLTWTIPGLGDQLDETTGLITGSWAHSGGGSVASTGIAQWAAGTGSRVQWTTAGISHGRRVRGETFLVPLQTNTYDGTGQVNPSTVSLFDTAAGALLFTNPNVFKIFSRPKAGAAGQATPILGAVVTPPVSSLRSRRT